MKHLQLAATCLVLGFARLSVNAQVPVTVSIDTSRPGPLIDREIYGQFAEHLGSLIYDGIWVGEDSAIPNTRGIRNDITAALRKIHVPVVRWPGGSFADFYHWRDGIGPRGCRPKRISCYGVLESNQFGTHEFMDFAEQIGAEAYVTLNVGTGTVQEAKDWIEYMTADKGSLAELRRENGRNNPWKVKYVGIGNEQWKAGGDAYVASLRRYSDAIESDSAIRKVACGPLNDDYAWTQLVMQNLSFTYPHSDMSSQFFEGLSLHYYTYADGGWVPDFKDPKRNHALGFPEDEWFLTLRKALGIEDVIIHHAAVMDRYDPGKRVAFVVDEWGTWYAPEPGAPTLWQQNSLRDALVAALTLNVFHRHCDRVRMANISQMINVAQSMILTDKEKMLVTPSYYVFDLYQPFQGATSYPASASGPSYTFNGEKLPMVDVSAAKGKDGKLYLALVNLDPHRSSSVTTNLTNKASGWILTAPEMDSHNTFEAPNSVSPAAFSGTNGNQGTLGFLLPAKSVAVVVLH